MTFGEIRFFNPMKHEPRKRNVWRPAEAILCVGMRPKWRDTSEPSAFHLRGTFPRPSGIDDAGGVAADPSDADTAAHESWIQ
jgi:hypothetical protein